MKARYALKRVSKCTAEILENRFLNEEVNEVRANFEISSKNVYP